MSVDERARHRLYLRLEEVLGPDEAGTLMSHLPPTGFADLATKQDLKNLEQRLTGNVDSLEQRLTGSMDSLEHRLTARMEQLARRLVMWTSSMVLAAAALAFAAGRFV
jgi:hypothetical protein